jgi:carbonic anhydrase
MAQCLDGHPNIAVTANMGECLYQCEYKYHYGLANIRATHNNGYISIEYQTQNKEFPVMFKGQEYSVSELRIYTPSLHKHNGKNTDAELVIVHSLCSPGDVAGVSDESEITWATKEGQTIKGALGGDACFYTYESLSTAKARCIDPPLEDGHTGNAPQCDGVVNIQHDKNIPKCGNKYWQLRKGDVLPDPEGGSVFTKELSQGDSMIDRDCPGTFYVCIPLSSTAPGASENSNILNTIIRETLPLQLGYHTDVFSFDSPFNLNKFIPDKKYFSYFANGLNRTNSVTCANYVVFSDPIGINSDLARQLSDTIMPATMPPLNNDISLLHSQAAPESMTKGKHKTDDIYIDCQPTDDSGQVLVAEDKPGPKVDPVSADSLGTPNPFATFWKYFYKFADILLGIFITMMIVMAVRGLLNPGSGIFNMWYWLKLVGLAIVVGYLSTIVAGGDDKPPGEGVLDYMKKGETTV